MTGSRSLPLLRVLGIRVGVNYSWFLILFVVIFVLWDSLSQTLDASDTTVYVVAVVAAASFFASIVAHELGHAFAARIGIGFGWLLMGGGLVLVLFADGYAFDGIWFAALGWLLASAARGTLAQTRFTEQIAGITVADVMDAEPVTIPAGLPAAQAYEDFFLRYQGWEWFAVVEDDGRYAGVAHRAAVEHAALREDRTAVVRELAAPGAAEGSVAADAPLEALLS